MLLSRIIWDLTYSRMAFYASFRKEEINFIHPVMGKYNQNYPENVTVMIHSLLEVTTCAVLVFLMYLLLSRVILLEPTVDSRYLEFQGTLKYFEIFVPRHIRFAELRKK